LYVRSNIFIFCAIVQTPENCTKNSNFLAVKKSVKKKGAGSHPTDYDSFLKKTDPFFILVV
jgi:hypothetical protein